MTTHTGPQPAQRSIPTVAIALAILLGAMTAIGVHTRTDMPNPTHHAATVREPQQAPSAVLLESSLDPVMTINGATATQAERLSLAVERFGDAGLALPDITVTFTSADACNGHYGLYEHSESSPTITICDDVDWVYEHELAHAWIAFQATDAARTSFMQATGYAVWNDAAVGWGERGVEGAAFVIQQTLGLPLPPRPSAEAIARSSAFTILTGLADPRLAEQPGPAPGDESLGAV